MPEAAGYRRLGGSPLASWPAQLAREIRTVPIVFVGASAPVEDALKLLILTGARSSEMITCRWDFVDLDHSLAIASN